VSGANFQIVNSESFVRNLDEYTDNPQLGSVVPFSASNPPNVVDEEYFSITVDSTQFNFQFQAWFEGDNIPSGLTVSAAQGAPASHCGSSLASASGSEVLTLDWCQIDAAYPTYLTVNYPIARQPDMLTSVDYQLAYSTVRTKEPITLGQGSIHCNTVQPDEPTYYSFSVGLSASQYWQLEIYAIDGNGTSTCDLNVFVNLGPSLATSNCYSEAFNCSGAACPGGDDSPCVWNNYCYTTGNVSVAVYNKNGAPVSFYIVYNVITVPVTALVTNQLLTVGSMTNPTSETYYFSVNVASVPTATQYFQVAISNLQGYDVPCTMNNLESLELDVKCTDPVTVLTV